MNDSRSQCLNSRYYANCVRKLKEMDLPITGWTCFDVEDSLKEGDSNTLENCELCGASVRFLHYMEHPDCEEPLSVGCVCAGVLEGDELAAAEREKEMKNRYARKLRFRKKKWRHFFDDTSILTCKHRGKSIIVISSSYDGHVNRGFIGYEVYVAGERVSPLSGRCFKSFFDAVNAAFEVADPPITVCASGPHYSFGGEAEHGNADCDALHRMDSQA